MSFLAPAQRGYESIPHSDLNHLPRVQMNSLPSFDNLTSPPPPPPHPVYHSNINHHLANDSPSSDRSPTNLPKVGQTRCYWSLLSPELQFLYLDPVLASHLAEQADLLLGKSLLEFVHPDEQASAENDLGGVLKSRTLHGSVTRVRYSRLSRVRRQLGYQGPADEWPDANKIALDANYMAVDIVINWAADGLVLCFMHAVVDLTARDNDENNKTGWTNWCGTPYMSMEQVQLMYQQLLGRVPQPSSMTRVFQVLLNQPDRPLWMSWPPDPAQGHGPTSKDFARLAEDVQIGNSVVTGTDAKTSCTRRYKALQTMHYGGNAPQEVESIFIPYGSIIFACHRSNTTYSRPSGGSNMAQSSHHTNQYDPPISQQPFDPSIPSYSVPPPPPPNYGNSTYLSQLPHHTSSQYPSNNWSSASDVVSQQQYNQWASPDTPVSSSPTVSNLRSSAYPPPQQLQSNQWSSHPPYLDSNASSYSIPPPQGMPYAGSGQATMPVTTGPPSPGSDAVPPSRIPRRGARDTYGNGGRGAGNPPVGINRCTSCKVTHSPEWRKGPSGKKDLCNACGLRFARSRARKEGGTQRRRKERVVSPPTNGRPPIVSSNLTYPNVRRGYNESNFAAGSPPANEVFSQSTAFAGMTRSPSPPAGSNYAPYAQTEPHGENRPHFTPQSSSAFYALPPPNTSSATHHPLHGSAQARLNSITPFPPTQLSPVVSPNTPPSSSPLNTAFGASSYEREKHRERDQDRILLPPTSSTAQPRNAPVKSEYLSH